MKRKDDGWWVAYLGFQVSLPSPRGLDAGWKGCDTDPSFDRRSWTIANLQDDDTNTKPPTQTGHALEGRPLSPPSRSIIIAAMPVGELLGTWTKLDPVLTSFHPRRALPEALLARPRARLSAPYR